VCFFYLFLRKAVVGLKENLIAKKVVFAYNAEQLLNTDFAYQALIKF
jgi:hypothetical protein